jgi:hypothetical protein
VVKGYYTTTDRLNTGDVTTVKGETNQGAIYSASPFNNVNPYEIENIEVLKDADATAIYSNVQANLSGGNANTQFAIGRRYNTQGIVGLTIINFVKKRL